LSRPAHGGRDRHVALAVSDLANLVERLDQTEIAYTLSQSGVMLCFAEIRMAMRWNLLR